MIRIYVGVKGANSFLYKVQRITNTNTIDKRFKYLYAYGNDCITSVQDFYSASSGEVSKLYKSAFKRVPNIKNKQDIREVWLNVSQVKLILDIEAFTSLYNTRSISEIKPLILKYKSFCIINCKIKTKKNGITKLKKCIIQVNGVDSFESIKTLTNLYEYQALQYC